jgi:hypothetical protein
MKRPEALSVSIGALAVVDTYLTATLISVPVWVTFIAWASYFAVGGGGRKGFVQSIACNLTGIAIASVTLLVIALASLGTLATAVAVGVGSAAMVQASKLRLLSVTPAIVWGFASTVGTSVATGVPITSLSWTNPMLVASLGMLLGDAFGLASEFLGNALEKSRRPDVVGGTAPTV